MEPLRAGGVGLIAAGTVGYALGLVVAYPGRAFTLTALMVGICLVVLQGSNRGGHV
jgi:hypothetical protein